MRVGPKKFAEPVSLSSTTSADLPLPGTAFGTGFVLLALRARRKQDTNPCKKRVKGSETVMCAICALFFFQQRASKSCSVTGEGSRGLFGGAPIGNVRRKTDHKNSPSRFRFRPPLPLTFPFRVLPSDSVSTYLRSVLGASTTLTRATSGSRCRKKTWPQFADISLFNISTAFLPTCGQGCGDELRGRRRGVRRTLQAGSTTRTASADSSRSSASGSSPTPTRRGPRRAHRRGRGRARRSRLARRGPATSAAQPRR